MFSLDMTLGSVGSLGFTESQGKSLAIARLSFLSFWTCYYFNKIRPMIKEEVLCYDDELVCRISS